MRNGFTLVELLGTIVILGIIAIITTSKIASVIHNSEDKASKEEENRIVNSARAYMADSDRAVNLPKSGSCYVSVTEMQDAGILKDDIDNASNSYVKITTDGKKYDYRFETCDSDCTPLCNQ